MNTHDKRIFALAAAGLMAVGAPAASHASVMADAVSQVSNFTISSASSGNILQNGTDFTLLSFTSTGGYAGTLPGTPGYNLSSSATPVNLPEVCVGNGCTNFNAAYGPDNSFTHLVAPPVGNYSAADQNEAGAPVAGVPDGKGGFIPTPASASSASYAGLTTQVALSHSTATNNLQSKFTFKVAQAGGLNFAFDVNAYLLAYVSGGELNPQTFATSALTVNFTLTDVTSGHVLNTFSPDIFGNGVNTISLNGPALTTEQLIQDTGGNAHFSFTSAALNTSDTYQLSARNNTNADAQRVPEPGVVALMGIGLLGLGIVRARRSHRPAPGALA